MEPEVPHVHRESNGSQQNQTQGEHDKQNGLASFTRPAVFLAPAMACHLVFLPARFNF